MNKNKHNYYKFLEKDDWELLTTKRSRITYTIIKINLILLLRKLVNQPNKIDYKYLRSIVFDSVAAAEILHST